MNQPLKEHQELQDNSIAMTSGSPVQIKKTSIEMVGEFHVAFNQNDPAEPFLGELDLAEQNELEQISKQMQEISKRLRELAQGSKSRAFMRLHLSQEELAEMAEALADGNVLGVVDALTDRQYVLDGDYLAFGLAKVKQPALEEVHRSNMSKLDENGKPILDQGGRVLKGENYSPPDLLKVMGEVYS